MRAYLVAKHTNAFPAEPDWTHVLCCAAVGTHGSLQPDCYCAVAGAARGRMGMSQERVFAFRFFSLGMHAQLHHTHQAMTTASLVLPNWVSSDVSDVGLFRRCDTNNATKCADIKPQVSSCMQACASLEFNFFVRYNSECCKQDLACCRCNAHYWVGF